MGRTMTYLPAVDWDQLTDGLVPDPEFDSVPPPGRPQPDPRGTNWRPSSATVSSSRGLGLGPQTFDPYG